MPIISRLLQAMKSGVNADDLAACDDDEVGSDTYLDTDDDGDDDGLNDGEDECEDTDPD